MIPEGDLLSAGIIGSLFLLLLGGAELWARKGNPRPEWTRKLVHLGGGAISLSFPFFINSPWVVLGMALSLSALFWLGAEKDFLKSLHSVDRSSRGSEYYPLAIFFVFLLSADRVWIYIASVLTLALADSFASLVGGRYGRIRYEVGSSSKSLEGSLAFLLLAFFAIYIPCMFMTELPGLVCLFCALLVATLVTGFEAVSLRGSDNLFVPIGVCVILGKITLQPFPEILFQTSSLVVICMLIAITARRSRSFNSAGTIMFALFAYGAWSLGSVFWALPILLTFAVYALVWIVCPLSPQSVGAVKVSTMFPALLVPLVLLVSSNSWQAESLFYAPYLASWATVSAFTFCNHFLMYRQRNRRERLISSALFGVGSWLIVAVPPWLFLRSFSLKTLLVMGCVAAAAALLQDCCLGKQPSFSSGNTWTASRLVLTLAAALAVMFF